MTQEVKFEPEEWSKADGWPKAGNMPAREKRKGKLAIEEKKYRLRNLNRLKERADNKQELFDE